MPEEIEYFENKRSDRTYISKPFQSPDDKDQRFISKVFDHSEHNELVEVKGELVLRVTDGMRDEVKAVIYEDDRRIQSLMIQRFTRTTGRPHKTSFSFHGDEIRKLYRLIHAISVIPLPEGRKDRLDDDILDELLRSLGDVERRKLLAGNIELIEEIARNDITSSDVIALGYRKEQLGVFENLVADSEYFAKIQTEWNAHTPEAVWQTFFERNPWIFGYGLQYVFTDRLKNQRLEQVVEGFSISGRGKRIDALLRTVGAVSSLCFVELKRHDTDLLVSTAYRPGCWQISREVAGAVAQIQKTVQQAGQAIREKLTIHADDGEPSFESAFLFHPKAFVVVGNLDEFVSDNGVNQQKFGSFELFRRNLASPEILTYDELLCRAKCILLHSETEPLGEVDDCGDIGDLDVFESSSPEAQESEEVPF